MCLLSRAGFLNHRDCHDLDGVGHHVLPSICGNLYNIDELLFYDQRPRMDGLAFFAANLLPCIGRNV